MLYLFVEKPIEAIRRHVRKRTAPATTQVEQYDAHLRGSESGKTEARVRVIALPADD